MISRLISRSSSHLRFLTLISSNPSLSSYSPAPTFVQSSSSFTPILQNPNFTITRYFSSNHDNNNGNSKDPSISASTWKLTDNNEGDSIFGDENASLSGIKDGNGDFYEGSGVNVDSWGENAPETDIFGGIDKEFESKKKNSSISTGDDEWKTADGYKGWSFGDDEKDEIFDIGVTKQEQQSSERVDSVAESETNEADNKQFEEEQKLLSDQLKGPNRAFGDLIAASGITDAMLDSLIALKDLEGVEGLPPLREIEDMRLERSERKSTNAEIERKKQEEVAKARVRQVDEKGRAYGTGRRKCSIARVWIQPGDGKFTINDKQFDVYFPVLDHRADLLRPFSETKTLGLWDVTSTVKGGGVSGQVGALRLGISRALQNWEPGLRPYLRSEGFLTRDSRVVERKKPGKAKARKSFQWVKR